MWLRQGDLKTTPTGRQSGATISWDGELSFTKERQRLTVCNLAQSQQCSYKGFPFCKHFSIAVESRSDRQHPLYRTLESH